MKVNLLIKFYLLTSFVIVFFSTTINAQVVKPFSVRYQTTQKGGIVYLANVAVSCSSNPQSSGGACQTASLQVAPAGTGRNNSFNQVYVDIDGDASTFQSSSDSLNLPNCSNITWAGLYWGAQGNAATAPTRNNIKIKTNNGAYQNISSDVSQLNTTGYTSYHNFKDITSIVQSAGTNARFTLANIPYINNGSSNNWGSWQIVVVYSNQLQNMRQLTVFDGLANVSGSSIVNVPISGFLTPPTGPVNFELGTYVHDGDRSSTGDQMLFSGNGGPFINVTNAINPATDVFNSTVSNKGVVNPFGIPLIGNTMGLDADIFEPNNATKNYLGNSNTNATLRLTTGGETYLVQEISTAIDVYEPDLRVDKMVTDRLGNNMYSGTIAPGDTLTYRIKVYNIGSDSSINTFITDSIPNESTFVPGSIRYVFGPNSGNKTDGLADDQGEYEVINGKLKFRVGTGANGISGGKVGNSPTGIDSTVITYRVTASTDCMILKCNNLIANRAMVTSTGLISGNSITNGSNPAAFDAFGCPISGTTNTFINVSLAGCAFPADTTIASICPATQTLASVYTRSGYTSFFNSSFTSVVTAATPGTYYSIRTGPSGCKDTVAITISATVCTPPNIGNDCTTTAMNTVVNGNMGINNYFPLGYSSTFFNTVPLKNASNGIFSINSSGVYSYLPNSNFVGADTVVVSYCGVPSVPGPNLCFNDTLFINVIGNPIINIDSTTTVENTLVSGNILTNNSHPNGGTFYANTVPIKDPSNGNIDIMPNGDYSYTPNFGFVGRDTVVFNVCVRVVVSNCTTDTVTTCRNDTLIVVVTAAVVGGGGGGGVESKSLGNVIAQRLYGNALVQKSDLKTPFIPIHNATPNGPLSLTLADLAPIKTFYSDKAIISTPVDLLNFTNAIDILAVDYSNNNLINSVFFATKTLGETYSHTKQICDRLKRAELLDVKILSANDYSVIGYKIKQLDGTIEFAANLTLGVNANKNTITLQSSWFANTNIISEQMYNVQLWANNESSLQNMVSDVIANASTFGKIDVLNESTTLPQAYVSMGNRTGTNVNVTVQNNTSNTTGYFELKEKQNEGSVETVRQVPFTVQANKATDVSLPVSDYYEASIHMYLNNKLTDLLYMSDGTWSVDYNKNNTTINSFNVANETNPTTNASEHRLFRNVTVTGTTKDYITVYKTINGGGLEQNLSNYKGLKFVADATGLGQVKVTIVKKGIQNWTDQYSYTLNLDGTSNKEYALGLSEFKSSKFNAAINANDVLAVNFSFNNTRGGTTNTTINMSKVRFTTEDIAYNNAITSKTISVYPNPSNGKFTTTLMSDVDQSLVLRVIDMTTGKIIKTQFINAKKGKNVVGVEITSELSSNGMYSVLVEGDAGKYQVQKLMLNRK